MFKNMAKYPGIGSNGGTAAGLVGSYDTVATRIAEFVEIGIDTFMLQFQPFTTEMRCFAAEVMPRVRRREAPFKSLAVESAAKQTQATYKSLKTIESA